MRLENMRMYQASEQLVAEVEKLLPRARARNFRAADHLERSLNSEHFNLAEGIGLFRPAGKIAAYEIARKEANEVRAVLRRLVIGKVFTQDEIQKAYDLAGAIVGMLTAAIIAQERRLESQALDATERKTNPRPRPPHPGPS